MIEIALAILAVGLFFIGYFLRSVYNRLHNLAESIRAQLIPPKHETPVEPTSMLIEPLTPEQEAQRDFAERVKRLNP